VRAPQAEVADGQALTTQLAASNKMKQDLLDLICEHQTK
jgi:hypothetical protein